MTECALNESGAMVLQSFRIFLQRILILALLQTGVLYACSYSVENPDRKNTNIESDFLYGVANNSSLKFLKNCFAILPDPNFRKKNILNNNTLLQLAIQNAEKKDGGQIVDWLISVGADVNLADENGISPLMEAVSIGSVATVKRLLKTGAKIGAKTNKGDEVLHFAWGSEAEMVRILVAAGADVNALSNDGHTALMDAAITGRTEIVRQLLKAGAKVTTVDSLGKTPLIYAMTSRKPELIKLLLDKKSPVNHADNSGFTALFYAAKQSDAATVRLLLKSGADPAHQDKKGKTAADWATGKNQQEIIDLLKGS